MKNNKLAIILIVAVFALFALGSGSSGSNSNSGQSSNTSSNTAPSSGSSSQKAELPTIDEAVIFDEQGIVITAKEIVNETIWGQGVKLLIENNSESDMTVSASAMAVNGYMITDLLYETLTAGTKVNTTLHCLGTELSNAGIKNIGEVDVWFTLVNPSNYNTVFSASEPAVIKTSLYDKMETDLNVEGTEVVNQNGVRVVVKYVDENSFWGTSVLIYVENNSGRNISITAENVSVNGFMITGYFYSDVKDGYKAFDTMTFFDSELKENDIDKIESIKMTFRAFDTDSYTTLFETDYVTVEVN